MGLSVLEQARKDPSLHKASAEGLLAGSQLVRGQSLGLARNVTPTSSSWTQLVDPSNQPVQSQGVGPLGELPEHSVRCKVKQHEAYRRSMQPLPVAASKVLHHSQQIQLRCVLESYTCL